MNPVRFGAVVATKVSVPQGPFHTGPYKGPWVDVEFKLTGKDKQTFAHLAGPNNGPSKVEVRGAFHHTVGVTRGAQPTESKSQAEFTDTLSLIQKLDIPATAVDKSVPKPISKPAALKSLLFNALFENQWHASNTEGRQAVTEYLSELPNDQRNQVLDQARKNRITP